MAQVYPLPTANKRKASELTPWQPGTARPTTNGSYLREFDEGVALSEFNDGQWLRDGFFASDIQDARWRGLRAPAN